MIENLILPGYQICDAGYSDFFDFLAKVALNVWDDEEGIEQAR